MNSPILKDHDRDSKEAILLAAIEVFGRKSYSSASTDEIVKKAGVSKGLLFHYYKSKNNLYLESLLYVMNGFAEYMEQQLDFSGKDMFARIKNILEVKMAFCCKNPIFLGLMEKSWYLENKDEIPGLDELFKANVETLRDKIVWSKFFKDLDTDKFGKDIDIHKALDYTFIAAEACWQRFSRKNNGDIEKIINNMDTYIAEADEVINLIKYGAYKRAGE